MHICLEESLLHCLIPPFLNSDNFLILGGLNKLHNELIWLFTQVF